jgi:hypothetical protein
MSLIKERIRAVINSKNRLQPLTEPSHNFTFSFNNKTTRITEIVIERIEIPYSFYAVNSTNNVLTFNNGTVTATITPGNYTSTTIQSELKTKIDAAFADTNTTITFSPSTYKLTITRTTAFIIDSMNSVPASTASNILGFRSSTASATSATASGVINISGPNYIIMRSTFLTKPIQHRMLYSDTTYQNNLWAIPLSASPGDIIFESPNLPIKLNYKFTIAPTDIIDIQLYDDSNNFLDLNGLDWAMQLIFITE